MRQSLRIRKKILTYSFLCKLLGIIDEEEYEQIIEKYSRENRDFFGK